MSLSLVTVVATDSFKSLDPRRKSVLLPWVLLTCGMLLHLVGSSLEQVPHGRAVPHTERICKRTVVSAVAQWLRCCATNRKVTGSIPDDVTGIFH